MDASTDARRAVYVVVWDGTPATSRHLSAADERQRHDDPHAGRRAYAEYVLAHSTSADRRRRAAQALKAIP